MTTSLLGKGIVVTGAAGFLGSHIISALRQRGIGARQIHLPRKADYDLVDRNACRRLLADTKPDIVFHLAARVGGIGANRENPGLFLYENAVMGLHLIEECRLAKVSKVVIA